MKFSEILKAVKNAWGFAWPPIVALAVVFWVSDYVSAFSIKNAILTGLGTIHEKMGWLKEVKAMLNEYGLAKMVTVFAGVLLVVVLYLIKHVGLSLVGALPPFLEVSVPRLLLRLLPDKEVVRLLRRYPGAESFKQAYAWGLAEVQMSRSSSDNTPDSVGLVVSQLTKLAAVTAVVVACVSIRSHPGPVLIEMLTVLVVCALVWFGTAISVLRDQHQAARELWISLRSNLLKDTEKLSEAEIELAEFQRVAEEKRVARAARWWSVRFVDGKVSAWCRENLLSR
ncbi:hypothetical protein ACFQY0_12500 [Haloferula chungangensis]|uniref:Uncharacterized protein n=1 Tax=Haloferula chungangensis TaxID=1048331 RepID=A0ABW2L8E8_9BACT